MNIVKSYRGLNKDIYYLCLARTINSLGDFVFSLITLFLTLHLGMDALSTGVFVSLAALISGPGVLIGGYLSDLIGKRKIIILGQIVSSLLVIGCSIFSESIVVAYILIAAMLTISITRPAYNALVIHLTTDEKERKSSFSLMYLGVNLGIATGPLIAGFFIRDYVNIVFASIGIVFFISSLIINFFVSEPHIEEKESKSKVNENKAQSSTLVKLIVQKPLVTLFIIVSFLNYFIYMQSSFSLPIQMNTTFGDNGPTFYGTLMTINAISVIVLTTFILSLTHKINVLVAIAIGALFYGVGFGLLGSLNTFDYFVLVIVSTVLWTIGEILIQTNINLYIASNVPDSHQGRFNGLLLFVGCLGYTLSPYLTGAIINRFNIGYLWLVIFGISIIYFLMIMFLYYMEGRNNRRRTYQEMDNSSSI